MKLLIMNFSQLPCYFVRLIIHRTYHVFFFSFANRKILFNEYRVVQKRIHQSAFMFW
jgi:hypothetical protein